MLMGKKIVIERLRRTTGHIMLNKPPQCEEDMLIISHWASLCTELLAK